MQTKQPAPGHTVATLSVNNDETIVAKGLDFQEAREVFARTLESTSEGVFLIDPSGIVLSFRLAPKQSAAEEAAA